jgi:hypothetical protein
MADLLAQLERTRPGYQQECELHQLYLSAYDGSGGFSGAVQQPTSGFWGSAAEVYSNTSSVFYDINASTLPLTYLDRYPREDEPKFRRRIEIAHYPNYIGPLTDLKLAFIDRKEFSVENRPDRLVDWREDVDGRGTTWDEMLPSIRLRAATVGWCPVLVDMPQAPTTPDGEPLFITRAAADELGLRPIVVPLFPANLTEYQCDAFGDFVWAKIRTDYVIQLDPMDDPHRVTYYTIWRRDRFSRYEVSEKTAGLRVAVPLQTDVPHGFGCVPLAILPHKQAPNDPVKGIAMHGQESIEARALFNRMSELDEHLRSQVFALLVLAMGENESKGQIEIGTDNAIRLDPASGQQHYFLTPGTSVAEVYENRISTTITEIYRQARVEFARPESSRQAVSGIARKFEFAQTNSGLVSFAQQIARFEEHIDYLAGTALGIPEEQLEAIQVTAPQDFDIEDMTADLQIAVEAINMLKVGPTAERLLRGRVIQQLIPKASQKDMDAIEQELIDLETELAQQRALEAEMLAAANAGEDEEPEDEEEENPEQPPAEA